MRGTKHWLSALLVLAACGSESSSDDAADGSAGDGDGRENDAGSQADAGTGSEDDGSQGDGNVGDGSEDGSPGEGDGITRVQLIGTWHSGCRVDAPNYYGVNELVITDTTYTVRYAQYLGDATCSDASTQVNASESVYSSWSLGGVTALGSTEFDAVVQQHRITLLDDATVAAWGSSGCAPFTADEPKDVSGLTCYGYKYQEVGMTAYSVFQLVDGELFAGDHRTAEGTTPETRPSVLDMGEGRTYRKD